MSDDLYAVLHVQPDADPREIKKAYFGLVRQFPPETHAQEFQRIREAYETLSNPEARKAYDASRAQQASAGLREELAAIMRDAIAAMEAREFEKAVPLLTGVVNENAAAEEPRARLCACLLNLGKFAEALTQAREFATHHPTLALAELYSGYATRELSRFDEARAHFVRASELDPLDFRPIRSVVDLDFRRKAPEAGLQFLEERLKTAAESNRLPLQLERVSVLYALKRIADGDAALEVLEKAATSDEAREELSWFYEREAASFFARSDPTTADRLLERLVKLQPSRALTQELNQERAFHASALPEESVQWLAEQAKTPWVLYLPRYGSGFGALMSFISFGLTAFMLTWLFHLKSEWSTGEHLLAAMFAGGLASWSAISLHGWWRSMGNRLSNAVVAYQLGFVEVSDDVVRVLPFSRLTNTHAVHHHTNGSYSHTQFNLAFGLSALSFAIHSQVRAEQFANNLHELRMRMLDLMHGGLLAGDRSVEFFPSAEQVKAAPSPKKRTWPLALAGATAGIALSVLAGMVSARTAARLEVARAVSEGSPTALRAFLASNSGPDAEPVRAQLLSRRAEAVRRLGVDAPALAAALRDGGEKGPVVVHVTWKSELDTSNAGIAVVPADLHEVRARENGLQAELQRRAEALVGPGWFKFAREADSPAGERQLELSVDYRLEFTPQRYLLQAKGASTPTQWAAPQLTAQVKWLDQARQLTAAPDQRVRLNEPLVDILASGKPQLGAGQLIDATWSSLTEQTAGLLGLRSL